MKNIHLTLNVVFHANLSAASQQEPFKNMIHILLDRISSAESN